MKHKCNGCKYKGEFQEPGFIPFGVCYKEKNLIDAQKAFDAEECPYSKGMNGNDFLPVKVSSQMSAATNCLCDFCHKATRVIKLTIPRTLYHDGKKLSTKYKEMWICEGCRDMLRAAIDLEYPKEEEK